MTRQSDKQEVPVQPNRSSRPASTSEYLAHYEALAKFIMRELPDTLFSPVELTELIEINGGLWVTGLNGAAKLAMFSLQNVRDRLAHLESPAALAARPRVRACDADSSGELHTLFSTGAFYRSGGGRRAGTFIWDTVARWYWDPNSSAARLWNSTELHVPSSNVVDVMETGNIRRTESRGSGKRRVNQTIRFDPVSKLPDGVALPEVVSLTVVQDIEPEPESAPQPAQPQPQPVPKLEPTPQPALPVHGPAKVLANEAAPGGTLVLQIGGQLFITEITKITDMTEEK